MVRPTEGIRGRASRENGSILTDPRALCSLGVTQAACGRDERDLVVRRRLAERGGFVEKCTTASPGYGVAQYESALKGRVVVVGGFVPRGFTPGYRMSPLRGDRISPPPLAN